MVARERQETTPAVIRLGVLMRADGTRHEEAGGVLNPGCARGRDGNVYLFPRFVDASGVSRIGRARVIVGEGGHPSEVERLGLALEPTEGYERAQGVSGCEDPRVTYVPALDRYVMTYVAMGARGPRIALAVSKDLRRWRRLGLVQFAPARGIDWSAQENKNAALLSEPVIAPNGSLALALLHRPMYQEHLGAGIQRRLPTGIADPRPAIWLSYASLDAVLRNERALLHFDQHTLLAAPGSGWQALKIGCGPPPLLTHLGWILLYHGVSGRPSLPGEEDARRDRRTYASGMMVLDRTDPRRILYRSHRPLLRPAATSERVGAIPNVVFPTGIDVPGGVGPGALAHVYYGMADSAIGVAALTLPTALPLS